LHEEEGHKLSERSEFFASQIRPKKNPSEDLNCDRLRQLRNEGSQGPSFWAAFLLLLLLWPPKKRRILMA
jgi:hypothetical protein